MRESKIIEKVINLSVQEAIIFLDNVSIIDFPYDLQQFVNILGVAPVLNLMLVTPQVYIKKGGMDKFKINNNFEASVILSDLHADVKKNLIEKYGGEKIELPTIYSIKRRTLFRVYKDQCLALHREGRAMSDIFRIVPLSKYLIREMIMGKQ
jgi:hypothetical protein